jgi:hypothetical protein
MTTYIICTHDELRLFVMPILALQSLAWRGSSSGRLELMRAFLVEGTRSSAAQTCACDALLRTGQEEKNMWLPFRL